MDGETKRVLVMVSQQDGSSFWVAHHQCQFDIITETGLN